jgi:hypothetical protein
MAQQNCSLPAGDFQSVLTKQGLSSSFIARIHHFLGFAPEAGLKVSPMVLNR